MLKFKYAILQGLDIKNPFFVASDSFLTIKIIAYTKFRSKQL